MKKVKKNKDMSKKGSAAIVMVGVFLVAGAIALGTVFSKNYFQTKTDKDALMQAGQLEGKDSNMQNEKKVTTLEGVLSFDRQEQSLANGEKFSLRAMIDPKGKKTSAAELHVIFDPQILELESIAPSEIFSLVLSGAKIDNQNGTASIVLGVPLGKATTEDIVQIAEFNFKTLSAKGKTEIRFSDKSAAAAEGESENLISSSTSAMIVVQ